MSNDWNRHPEDVAAMEADQWHHRQQQERERTERTLCPDCGGSGLSPYPGDGGSCPHCSGGYVR